MFFITYARPHKPVSSRELTRWVSDILQKVGIHTKTFKIHNLHSASTLNAFSGGFSLPEIAKAAGWTNVKTFGEFYNKPLIENNLGNLLLTKSLYAYRYVWYAGNRCLCDVCCFIYIYQFELWNLIWILIRRTGTDQQRNNTKITLAKWRLIGIIFLWEVPPPCQVSVCPPHPTQCDIPIEKIDIFKEGSGNNRSTPHEYLSG